jgi:hypothetical protein
VAREAIEDRSLVIGQFFADNRYEQHSPRAPTAAAQPAEIAVACKRLAHGDELAELRDAALRETALERVRSPLSRQRGRAFSSLRRSDACVP